MTDSCDNGFVSVTHPFEAHGFGSGQEWQDAVRLGLVRIANGDDRLAVAFSYVLIRARDWLVDDDCRYAVEDRWTYRAAMDELARSVGMPREQLRRTVLGQRWITEEEYARATESPLVGQRLLSALPAGVLHSSRDYLTNQRKRGTLPRRPKPPPQKRMRIAMSGTDDWERVQAALGRSLTRTDLVRLALASGKARTAKAIRDDLAKVGSPASASQVASCLYELRGRGEVYRVRYGTYQLKPTTG